MAQHFEFRRAHQLLGVKARIEERVAGIIFANVLLDSDGLSRQEKGHEISKIVSAVGPAFIMRMLQTTDPKMLTMKAALQLLAHACLSSSQLVLFAPHIDDFVRFILSHGQAAPRPAKAEAEAEAQAEAEAAEATSKAKTAKDDDREQTLRQALIILQYVAASSADLHLLPSLHALLRGATGTFAFPVLLLETSVQLLRHRLLNAPPASKAAAEQVLGTHASALRSLVVQCMHGLAPAETRRRALECLLQLLLLRPLGLGADWTVEQKQAPKAASQGGEDKSQGQFALLVCAVLRGEMHIVTEGILALEGARVEPLSSSRGGSQANANSAAEPSALVAKKRTCLVCCLVFVHMLPLLVGDGEDEGDGDGEGGEEGPWAALPPSVLEGVRRQGHSIVQDGLAVLGECAALLQQHQELQQQQQQDQQQQDKQQRDKQQESARELRALASALTATLCRWCSEDEALHAPLLDSLDAVLACSAVAGLARGRQEEQLERVWGVLSCRGERASEWGAAEEAVLLVLGELGAGTGAGLGLGRGEDVLHRLLPTLLSMQEPGGDDEDEDEEGEGEGDDEEDGGEDKASPRRTTLRLSHSPALAARLLTIVSAAAHCTPGAFAGLCDALGPLGRAAMAVEEEEREAAAGAFPQLEALVMVELARASREHAQGREGGERQRQWVAGVQTAQISAAQLALLLPALGLQATHHTPLKSSLPSTPQRGLSATAYPTHAALSAAQVSLRGAALQGKLLAKRLLLGCAACLLRSPPAPPGRGDDDGSQGGVEEYFGLLHALEHVSKSVVLA